MKIELKKVKLLNRYNVESLQRNDVLSDSTIRRFDDSTNSAFTLIEMILAIGVAAIVLAAANAVFFTALHLRNQTSDIVAAASPLVRTMPWKVFCACASVWA